VSELFLYDDARARAFEPFALTRPVGELRAGTLLLRERWERALGRPAAGHVIAEHLRDFDEPGAPGAAPDPLPAGSIVAHARCAVSLDPMADPDADAWHCDGRVAAVRLEDPVPHAVLDGGKLPLEALVPAPGRRAPIGGRWMDEVWDFIRHLTAQLSEDIPVLGAAARPLAPALGARAGSHPVFVEAGVTVEPMVFFDVTAGPVLIREGATVQAFTRIVGPCVVGAHSTVGTDRVAASAIGEHCRVHGELSTSVVLAYSNKGHDGFVGHSYLGRWVNLGAGTITSNLKNTYGSVSLWTPDGVRDTELQFLGAFIGDHAKTGIGTRLTTGSVIGAGANIFGAAVMPKLVPPFAWGDGPPFGTHALEKFLETAERMMQRRQHPLTDRARALLRSAHRRRWTAA
jgi:UDP-N-acetylglucosamine diphosphorylase/glucosamine-1-phosphate N-acetyltransferase